MKRVLPLLLSLLFLLSGCASPAFDDGVIPTVVVTGNTQALSSPPPANGEPTTEPTTEPTLDPLPEYDETLFLLVNIQHPLDKEIEGDLITPHLTVGNVECDERRHADARASRALNEMLLAAEAEGEFHFIIASAFRWFWEQELLWNAFVSEHPGYALDPSSDPVSALPRDCSEHSTGLAFDILCDEVPHGNPAFVSTREGRWLIANAHRFGFILRYPADKQTVTGVCYEPWHFRYVGKEAAEYIYSHGLCLEEFLDLYDWG